MAQTHKSLNHAYTYTWILVHEAVSGTLSHVHYPYPTDERDRRTAEGSELHVLTPV